MVENLGAVLCLVDRANLISLNVDLAAAPVHCLSVSCGWVVSSAAWLGVP